MGWAARLNTTPREVPRRRRPLSEKAQRDAVRALLPIALWLRAAILDVDPVAYMLAQQRARAAAPALSIALRGRSMGGRP